MELETLEVPLDDDAVQSQAGPRLVSLNSKHADIVFTAQAPVTIGRRFDNTVVFDDQRISQVHCKFYFEGDLLHVHDQRSGLLGPASLGTEGAFGCNPNPPPNP